MTAIELMIIKKYQRDFQEKFDKRLEIDFISMKGIQVTEVDELNISVMNVAEAVDLDKILDECVKKHGADVDKIKERGKRLQVGAYTKERLAVREFCKIVIHLKGNINQAARLINRDRSVIYHYAGMR